MTDDYVPLPMKLDIANRFNEWAEECCLERSAYNMLTFLDLFGALDIEKVKTLLERYEELIKNVKVD